jgi:hypothetical protein
MLTHGGSASAPNRWFADAQVIMTLCLISPLCLLGYLGVIVQGIW